MRHQILIDILKGARALLLKKENWTKGTLRRNAKGDRCRQSEPPASFCLMGAIQHASLTREEMYSVIDKIIEVLPKQYPRFKKSRSLTIARFNDAPTTKHGDILYVLDCAILSVLSPEKKSIIQATASRNLQETKRSSPMKKTAYKQRAKKQFTPINSTKGAGMPPQPKRGSLLPGK